MEEREYYGRIRFVIVQLATFVALLYYCAGYNVGYLIPALLTMEAILLAIVLFKKEGRYAIFFWQALFFVAFFVLMIEEPSRLLNYSNIPGNVHLFVLLAGCGLEAATVAILLFERRSIKGLLKLSSLGTVLVVVLIVGFVASEGMMAFVENDPVELLTTSAWEVSYDPTTYEAVNIIPTIRPYGLTMSFEDADIHIPAYAEISTNITLANVGALDLEASLIFQASVNIKVVAIAAVSLHPGEVRKVPVSLNASLDGQYLILAEAAFGPGQEVTASMNVTVVESATDIVMDARDISISGSDATYLNVPVGVVNRGTDDMSITLKIASPQEFRPFLIGLEWNYSADEGRALVPAQETAEFNLIPRMIVKAVGTYELILIIQSQDGSELDREHLRISYWGPGMAPGANGTEVSVAKGVPTFHNITLQSFSENELGARVVSVPSDMEVSLFVDGVEYSGEDFVSVRMGQAGNANLTLLITSLDGTQSGAPIVLELVHYGMPQKFGIFAFIMGTVITTVLALMIAVPLALGTAVFLAEYCPSRVSRSLKPVMELLAGIPSVVYGLWGFLTLGPLLASTLYPFISSTLGSVLPFFRADGITGNNMLTASIVLAIMILPIILTLSHDALISTPRELKESALSLGASKWQMIRRVMFRQARSGISASIVLGTGRAIGETMAVLMIMGAASSMPNNIFGSVGTMTTIIAGQFGSYADIDTTRHVLFAVASVLFLMVLSLNIVVLRLVRDPLEKKRFFLWAGGLGNRLNTWQRRASGLLGKLRAHLPRKAVGSWKVTPTSTLIIGDRLMKAFCTSAAIFVLAIIAYILGNIILRGGLTIELSYLLEIESASGQEGGFLNAIWGSFLMVGLALVFAVLLAVGAALYAQEYAEKGSLLSKATLFATSTLASTPSIIFGAFGFLFLILYLDFEFSVLTGGLTLGFMIIPLIYVSSFEALKTVPESQREGSYALGASKWDTIKRIVVPGAFSSMCTGVIIAMGRAIGETAAVLFTAGYATYLTTSLLEPAASMPNMIYQYYDLSSKFPIIGEKLYALSFVLILFVLGLNILARLINRHFEKKNNPL